MDILDFFWPQWAQARHLRQIAESMSSGHGRKASPTRAAAALQVDVNTLALVCMGLVAALMEKGVISELDLQMHLQKIDGIDAEEDGGLDPNMLRSALGMKKPPKSKALPTNAKLPRKTPKGGPVPRK
jgi:hypothetical protein